MTTIQTSKDIPTFIDVHAGVRYWEDASVNGVDDVYGTLIPLRIGDDWCITIHLQNGKIEGWPIGTIADIWYKVCDQGRYWLLNEHKQRLFKYKGSYVPDEYLCHGDDGYGDYIIFKVGEDGVIENWTQPEFNAERWEGIQ